MQLVLIAKAGHAGTGVGRYAEMLQDAFREGDISLTAWRP